MTNAPDKSGVGGLASPSDPGWQSLGDFNGQAVYVPDGADADAKDAAMNGHGSSYGSCGHKTGGCRCSHGGAVRRFGKEPCVDCATGTMKPATSSASAIILDASPLDAAKELPLVLTGQPGFEEIPSDEEIGKNADGTPIFKTRRVPIQYYKKEIARVGNWNNRGLSLSRGVPAPFSLTADHFDQVVRNFKDRQKAGIRPFLPDTHVERRDAAANNGEVIDVERKGDKLFGTLKVVGSGSMEKLLKNDVSVYLVDGSEDLVTDAAGKKYSGYVLHHVALTPNSALPHLGPFQRIAASADGSARDVPVYDFAGLSTTAAPRRKGSRMTPEIATKARATLSLSADAVPDDKLDDAVAEKALALSADLATRTTERDAALRERDAAKADADAKGREVLALSADDPANLTPANRAAAEMNADMLWDHDVKIGALSVADAGKFKSLVRTKEGRMTRLALSASGENGHPLEYNLARLIGGLATPLRTGTARPGDVTPAERIALDASGAANPDLQKQMIALANGGGGPIGGVAKMTRDEK
jgi:hypothetical protein